MRGAVILCVLILGSLFSSIAGCSQENDENITTIRTFLANEFTGPNEELTDILDKGPYPPELQVYLEHNYKDFVKDLGLMFNNGHVLTFLRLAYINGYQLSPISIDVKKIETTLNNTYDYKVEVEYSKNEKTETAIVIGIINLDDDGDILLIRKLEDHGLLEQLRH
ncbi:hypothetical protein EJF36_06700 [Bacillus sp. HMF5848]|uniref:hypothetical protein n=1 Tax=Bacillus sp. HMF5848 TaxID=2495421 RepID=UPI000F7A6CC8|nr:hypothetical protein [Bacillus sp. HMF5848]RSK26572.1 hypothetical protein EJF36_06700 [Bacillus sp. HMF5848]